MRLVQNRDGQPFHIYMSTSNVVPRLIGVLLVSTHQHEASAGPHTPDKVLTCSWRLEQPCQQPRQTAKNPSNKVQARSDNAVKLAQHSRFLRNESTARGGRPQDLAD